MSNFGTSNAQDYFGILTATIDGQLGSARATVVSAAFNPIELTRVNAQDECGDIVATRFIGNTSQNMAEVSTTYLLKNAGNLLNWRDPVLLLGHRVVSGVNVCVTSMELTTSNSDYPRLVLTGRYNTITPIKEKQMFAFPAFNMTMNGACAIPLGFTVVKGRLTSCSLSSSINLAQFDDGVGEPYGHEMTSGEGTISAELVRTSAAAGDAPAIQVTGTGLTLTQSISNMTDQATFNTATATMSFNNTVKGTP